MDNKKANTMLIYCCLKTKLQSEGEFAFVCNLCMGIIDNTASSLQLFTLHYSVWSL